MKILFLDNDGVICLPSEWGSRYKRKTKFDRLNKKAMKVLNEIIEKTGTEIVVSSDWKFHASLSELKKMYLSEGMVKPPMDATLSYRPYSDRETLEYCRMQEIKSYMEKYPDVTNWVAVDDMEMFDLGEEHFVHCPLPREGIKQLGIKEKIIDLLNR